jgi:hypothetical protein
VAGEPDTPIHRGALLRAREIAQMPRRTLSFVDIKAHLEA